MDWTHEREWRCRAELFHDAKYGTTPAGVIPLLLPGVHDYNKGKPIYYLPKILVRSTDDVDIVTKVIGTSLPDWAKECKNDYLKHYFGLLPKVKVVDLYELENTPGASELDWVIS